MGLIVETFESGSPGEPGYHRVTISTDDGMLQILETGHEPALTVFGACVGAETYNGDTKELQFGNDVWLRTLATFVDALLDR